MKLIRRAPYNRELIVLERWRVLYAPPYGWWYWRSWLRELRAERKQR